MDYAELRVAVLLMLKHGVMIMKQEKLRRSIL